MGVTVDVKQVIFDMPDPAAVEIARNVRKLHFQTEQAWCGAAIPGSRGIYAVERWRTSRLRLIIRRLEFDPGLVFPDHDAARFESNSPLHQILDSLGVNDVLLCEDAGRQRIHGIGIQHRDRRLKQNGAGVEKLVDQMDRAAGDFRAVFERLPLCIEAGKSREQVKWWMLITRLGKVSTNEALSSRINPARQTRSTSCVFSSSMTSLS